MKKKNEYIYTKEDMNKFDNSKFIHYFPLVKDFVIKNIFYNNHDLLNKFLILQIKDIIKLDYDNTTMTINNVELGKSNYKEYNKIVDTYVVLNNNIHIDLEYNTQPYSVVQKRNKQYLNKLATIILESGDKISKLNSTYVIQVNLNAALSDSKFGEDIIIPFGKKTCKEYPDYKYIVLKNIEYYRNLFYNEGVKLPIDKMCLVVISSRNFNELFDTLDYVVTKKEKNKLIKEVHDMFSDGFTLEQWKRDNAEALNAIAAHDAQIYYREEGLREGRAEGIKENVTKTIKNMLNKKCSLDFISEVTGSNKDEILEIKKTM